MTSAADNHVDHSQGDTWIRWQRNQGGDHPVWRSVVTDRSVPRKTPGGRTREAIEHRSVIRCMVIGVSCYTQLNWDWDSQRERYAWTSHDHISEKEELLAGRIVHEGGLRELVNQSVIGDSLNPLRAWHREGEIVYAGSNAWWVCLVQPHLAFSWECAIHPDGRNALSYSERE